MHAIRPVCGHNTPTSQLAVGNRDCVLLPSNSSKFGSLVHGRQALVHSLADCTEICRKWIPLWRRVLYISGPTRFARTISMNDAISVNFLNIPEHGDSLCSLVANPNPNIKTCNKRHQPLSSELGACGELNPW